MCASVGTTVTADADGMPEDQVAYTIPDDQVGSVPTHPPHPHHHHPLDGAVLSCFGAHDLFTVQAYHAELLRARHMLSAHCHLHASS